MNTHQITFDYKAEAIARGYANADDVWKQKALQLLEQLAKVRYEITADDLHECLERENVLTHDTRALAGVLAKGKKNGWLEMTERVTPSKRTKINHGRRVAVWRSLICRIF